MRAAALAVQQFVKNRERFARAAKRLKPRQRPLRSGASAGGEVDA